jgi:hypothetical protein
MALPDKASRDGAWMGREDPEQGVNRRVDWKRELGNARKSDRLRETRADRSRLLAACHTGGRGFESRRSRLYLQEFRASRGRPAFAHPALIPRELRGDGL